MVASYFLYEVTLIIQPHCLTQNYYQKNEYQVITVLAKFLSYIDKV